jgi:hypothetical protein
MYRAVTLAVLRQQVGPDDPDEVARVARSVKLTVGTDPVHPTILLDGANVAEQIRGPDVTGAVSAVSAVSVSASGSRPPSRRSSSVGGTMLVIARLATAMRTSSSISSITRSASSCTISP